MVTNGRDLKTAMERHMKAIKLRPSVGQGTATTVARIRSGVTCDIEDGSWKLIADESTGDGGAGLGPDPGVFTRAGLASCLAMGYVQWAAVLEIPIESVEVVVETDYDARGMFGIDDSIPSAWQAVRYATTITSPAPEERVRELLELADRRSPILDDIRRALPVTGRHEITSTARA